MTFETIDYSAAGSIARLVLNRPERLNAINRQLISDLRDAVRAANEDSEVRVIIVSGAGRAFCAGYDLDWGTKAEDATQKSMGGFWDPVRDYMGMSQNVRAFMSLWESPKPVIAQVHGYALAGGLELAMACDLVVAAEGARLGEPEIRFGSAPVTLLMPFLIGQKRTRELLLTGDLIDAVEAERIGLVNRVVPGDRLAAEVDALADRLARVDPDVMAPTKLMLNRAMDATGFATAVAMGLELQSLINMSEASREFDSIVRRDGLKAALAWRDARYDERLRDAGRPADETPG
jgi:enoyl-CoA hydratase/carnithine racemase